jgi:hypothetical protein
MRAVNLDLLESNRDNLKFIFNETAIVFFHAAQQHRDIKSHGLRYEDDHRGNALAGLVTAEKVEIRRHSAFSHERVEHIWRRVLDIPEIANAGLRPLYYQGREVR